ncbi:MAG: L-asparaginase [Bacteroidetes bacterium]|nr:MAG: L-asparaginase [Bacteroidota bacterium]
MKNKSSILLIYTGGTIGMVNDPKTGRLQPFDFKHLNEQIPELSKFAVRIDHITFEKPIDSSNMQPGTWIRLAQLIEKNYARYDGFVILHGSDTMAYTASALSFMLENLGKPVILTGSQLPIGTIRTDGKENLITSIEIAAARKKGKPIISEVCVYFEYRLYRGNRTHKWNSEQFRAFQSPNYPLLAEAGVHLNYHPAAFLENSGKKLKVHNKLDTGVAILKLFPGITEAVVYAVLGAKGVKAVILETFGSGNASTESWFIRALEKAVRRGIIILNITQCNAGSVIQGRYETSSQLQRIGVAGGGDMTTEAAVTKLMFLLGQTKDRKKLMRMLASSLRGEISL